jgi:Na+/H+ antiporter NhaC
MSIIVFTLLIGGMVGIISKNGGTRGVIRAITGFVRTKVQGQVVTALMGFIVFFDDYANTMVVGNTMRPLTDKLRISRAKLAYLVDATAAPVATIALVSHLDRGDGRLYCVGPG